MCVHGVCAHRLSCLQRGRIHAFNIASSKIARGMRIFALCSYMVRQRLRTWRVCTGANEQGASWRAVEGHWLACMSATPIDLARKRCRESRLCACACSYMQISPGVCKAHACSSRRCSLLTQNPAQTCARTPQRKNCTQLQQNTRCLYSRNTYRTCNSGKQAIRGACCQSTCAHSASVS